MSDAGIRRDPGAFGAALAASRAFLWMGINGITAADGREIPGILPWNPSQIPFFSQGKFPNNFTPLEFRPGAPRSLQDSSQIPFFSQGKFPKFPGSVPSRRPAEKKFPGKLRRPGRSTGIPSEAGSTRRKASIFPKNPLGGNSSLGIPRSGSSERQHLRFGKNLGKPGISRLFFGNSANFGCCDSCFAQNPGKSPRDAAFSSWISREKDAEFPELTAEFPAGILG